MTDTSLVKSLKRRNYRHKKRTGNIPFKMTVTAFNILLKRNKILVFLNNINCVIFFKNVVNIHKSGKLTEF